MAVTAALKDSGITAAQMAKMSGANRSTIYRWIGGDVQPDYDLVNRLAAALWRRGRQAQARELVEASGYAWADPTEAELPAPELEDDPETLEALRRAYRNDPHKVREAVEALRWAEGLPSARPSGDESSSDRDAG